MLLRFGDLSVSPLSEAFENIIDAFDVAHGSLPADPIDHDRPFERIEVALCLGEDLIDGNRGAPRDKTR